MANEGFPPGRVHTDHGAGRKLGREQGRFCREIGVHVAVVVEMIVTQVGKTRHRHGQTGQPEAPNGLRACLHTQNVNVLLSCKRNNRLNLVGFRCCQSCPKSLLTNTPLRAVAQGGGVSKAPPHILEKKCHRGFPVGPGHRVNRGGLFIRAIHPGGEGPQDLARKIVDSDRHRTCTRDSRAGRIGDHGDGSGGHRLCHKICAVMCGPGKGNKNITGGHRGGIDGDPGNRNV